MFSLPGQKEKKSMQHTSAMSWPPDGSVASLCESLVFTLPLVFFWGGGDAAVLHPEKLNAAEASVL